MITYTLIDNDYIVLRDGNKSITFNEQATDLWEVYQEWLEEGNEPLTKATDPNILDEAQSL